MNQVECYVKELDAIGDKIIEVSNSLPNAKDLEKFGSVKVIERLEEARKSYNAINNELKALSPPLIVKKEHKNLCYDFQLFASSVKILITSIVKVPVDEQLFNEGLNKQKSATELVGKVTNRMADKLERLNKETPL